MLMPQSSATEVPALIMVANAVTVLPLWVARLVGSTAEASNGSANAGADKALNAIKKVKRKLRDMLSSTLSSGQFGTGEIFAQTPGPGCINCKVRDNMKRYK